MNNIRARNLRTRLEQNLGSLVLILLAAGCIFVMWPFITALLWAGILTFSSWPIYRRLLTSVGERNTLAAAIMTLAMMLLILVPFTLVGLTLADQVRDLTLAARKWIDAGPPAPPEWLQKIPLLGKRLVDGWQSAAADTTKFLALLRRLLEPASALLLGFGVAIGRGLIHLALSLFICFFLFRNGTKTAERLNAGLVRISGERAGTCSIWLEQPCVASCMASSARP